MSKLAVVAFNLGGPDKPESIRPFLFNLFNDPMILRLPAPLRWLLAKLLSSRRARVAAANYAKIGGRSPILAETRKQTEALQTVLGNDTRVFVAMRYWHPMVEEVARAVRDYAPERVVLLPLYPQYSTTTTASFLRVWERARVNIPTAIVREYPDEPGFIAALARLTQGGIAEAEKYGKPRVLFSAHGLPKKIAAQDPYQSHVERTVAAVLRALGPAVADHAICYQSRVGPLEWIKPYTEDEIKRAGSDRVPVVVVPVAFVSEHSETLVELDMDYRALAARAGVPAYVRVPTVGTAPEFIAGLARLVRGAA
ncbi:MAG TPA: ferrochelatase [Alphaproteobacteria bacterium]